MSNETASYKQETVAPAKTFVNRDASQTRLIAGVSVPDGPLITAVIEHAQRLSERYLFNHAMRSWLFAEAIGRMKGIDYDREVVAIGTILHDIGLTASVSGPNRFEVNGADAALSFIKGKGLTDRRAQLVWDLVALNSTPSLALHKEPEVAVGTMGIGLDYGGFGVEALPRGQEMTEQANTQICGNGEKRYATREEFLKIFDQDMNGLYQLSFLLTGDHQKGESAL